MDFSMKTLYIVRHAKSDWSHPELSDYDRPLNQRGLEAAPMMGQRLREQGVQPDLIISSPAHRALSTAKLIAEQLDYSFKDIVENEAIYEAGCDTLVSLINELDNSHQHVMLVCHNPGATVLSNFLMADHVTHMPTCAIVAIEFPVDDWQAIMQSMGEKKFFETPR